MKKSFWLKKEKKERPASSQQWNKWKIRSVLISYLIATMKKVTGPSLHLPHYIEADSPRRRLPSACLFRFPCLPSLLTLCSLYCVDADMHGKKTGRRLSLLVSLCCCLSMSLTHLFLRSNKRGPGWGSPPLWQKKTSPLLMWHCATRPSRLKNLPLVNSCGVHVSVIIAASGVWWLGC